ncbi:hypothetical protein NDU88_009684 [Pleurodeles waltl]|uniref:Uncharacterized protein n=1 Tax=Pleurodeles waltl TaxID=8319 RepID=A0AAV7RYB6_PLEWA|nr:hypothetical protein NDU88_009684 [Pleurodeles waltl]
MRRLQLLSSQREGCSCSAHNERAAAAQLTTRRLRLLSSQRGGCGCSAHNEEAVAAQLTAKRLRMLSLKSGVWKGDGLVCSSYLRVFLRQFLILPLQFRSHPFSLSLLCPAWRGLSLEVSGSVAGSAQALHLGCSVLPDAGWAVVADSSSAGYRPSPPRPLCAGKRRDGGRSELRSPHLFRLIHTDEQASSGASCEAEERDRQEGETEAGREASEEITPRAGTQNVQQERSAFIPTHDETEERKTVRCQRDRKRDDCKPKAEIATESLQETHERRSRKWGQTKHK